MSHLFEKGFTVRQPAWHASTTGCPVLQDYPGLEPGMHLAGHDHEIVEQSLGLLPRDPTLGGAVLPLSGWKALVRKDTGMTVNVVRETYEVIQNRTPWECIDQLFQNGAKWDTAGVLTGHYDEQNREVRGQTYWCMALLDEPKQVKGDDSLIYPYIASTWNHQGLALRFRAMNTRIVCANTHHAAMYGSDGADLDVSIRHFGRVEQRIEKAKQAILMARKSNDVFMEMANELAAMEVSDLAIEEFVHRIVPMPDAKILTDRVQRNVEKSRQQLRDLFNGQTINSGIRNTAYGMVECGVEYFDHVRKSLTRDTYFTRNVMSVSAQKAALVDTAREIATEMAV